MGGEVALAGSLERIRISMAVDGLQRVAPAGAVMAIIGDQGRPALRGNPAGEVGGDGEGGG